MYQYNREDSDVIAAKIWKQKELVKTVSGEGYHNYRLTDKQHTLINTAVRSFQELYLDLLSLYDANNSQGLSEKIQNMVANYFAINRHQHIIGNNSNEAVGAVRGLYLIYRLRKEENNIAAADKKAIAQKEMQPLRSFFGSEIAQAKNLFNEYVIGIAIRFQFAIELLGKREVGLQNFAKYLAYMTIQKCSIKLNDKNLQEYDNNKKKISFMINLLTEHSAENDLWENKNLKLEGDHELSIDYLLQYSPIDSPIRDVLNRGFWYRPDIDKVNSKSKTRFWDYFMCCETPVDLPTQLCSDDELESRKDIYTLSKF